MTIYKEAKRQATLSEDNWTDSGGQTVTCALLGTGYTPTAGDEDTHRNWSQISGNEITTSGSNNYTRVDLSSKVLEDDDATNRVYFNAADANFGAIDTGFTVRWLAILRWDSGNNANSKILRVVDLRPYNSGSDVSTNGETFRIVWQDSHVFFLGDAA